MATYLIVNVIFLVAVVVLLRVRRKQFDVAFYITLTVLLLLTAVFDSLIVGLGIVGYNPDLLLGMYIGAAPIEDFFYAILAALIVPRLWKIMEKKDA